MIDSTRDHEFANVTRLFAFGLTMSQGGAVKNNLHDVLRHIPTNPSTSLPQPKAPSAKFKPAGSASAPSQHLFLAHSFATHLSPPSPQTAFYDITLILYPWLRKIKIQWLTLEIWLLRHYQHLHQLYSISRDQEILIRLSHLIRLSTVRKTYQVREGESLPARFFHSGK